MSTNFNIFDLKKEIHQLVKETIADDRCRGSTQSSDSLLKHKRKQNIEKLIVQNLKDNGALREILENLNKNGDCQEFAHFKELLLEPGEKEKSLNFRNFDTADKYMRGKSDIWRPKKAASVSKVSEEQKYKSGSSFQNDSKSKKKIEGKKGRRPCSAKSAPSDLQQLPSFMSKHISKVKESLTTKKSESHMKMLHKKQENQNERRSDKSKSINACTEPTLLTPRRDFTPSCDSNNVHIKVNPRKRHLHFEILGGRAFLDHLLEESMSMFVLFLHFRGQRFWTQPAPCIPQPSFSTGFLFELHSDTLGPNIMADGPHLLSVVDKIHLVLIRVLPNGDKHLVSSHFFEWRHILSAPQSQKSYLLELCGVGAESNITVGILEVRLTLVPKLIEVLSNKIILTQIQIEKNKKIERERIFLVYAKTWWKEFLSLRPEHSQRAVKIFQQDENSHMRPVFQYIHVLKVGRPLLEMPREAAWFVSLINLEIPQVLGAFPQVEHWWNPHTFLCLKRGSTENHAALLCSLLLGFGLDAYVCLGTKESNTPWAWVMTRGKRDVVIFWESTTGARYVHTRRTSNSSYSYSYPYRTIGCVFNHKSFYANIQESDKVKCCNFDLEDKKLWKTISEAAISSVAQETIFSLMPGWTDPYTHSQEMEAQLRYLISEYRKDVHLPTRWDVTLSHIIAPVLTIHEVEHKMGVIMETEEFNELISKNVPEGFAFKALPIRIAALKSKHVLAFCLRNSVLKGIITCQEPETKLALRIHTYIYPENVLSMWLVIACKFRAR